MNMRNDAQIIIEKSIAAVLPDSAVKKALADKKFGTGKIIVIAIGKAAWQMANAANEVLGDKIDAGLVITKYDHVKAPIKNFQMVEAGHPVPDENSFRGTQTAIDLVENLSANDTVIFLISGGGSSLFEKPLIEPAELETLTKNLLASGANISQINIVRKRLSAVKGGKFAKICAPAKVFSVILSDIIGDPLDMIASGPAYPDSSTCDQAWDVIRKFNIPVSKKISELLNIETPKELFNVETQVTGSVRELVKAAFDAARHLGYESIILTDCLSCEAREAGRFLASIAKTNQHTEKNLAFILGGETVVKVSGNGLGGRNQELTLAAAIEIASLNNVAIFSVGSDGTDGPTDAAGGYVDGCTVGKKLTFSEAEKLLANNDSYRALKKSDGLIVTGATGTNVNDLSVLLIKGTRKAAIRNF